MLNIVWLAACQPLSSLNNDLQDYQQRMARVLKHDSPPFISSYLPAYPSLNELSNIAMQTSIKLTEFYQLQHCHFASLIAERNTSLGKLQLPSIRYHYEKQLIQGLQECIKQTNEPELKAQLQVWLQIKQQNLPLIWADMLQKSTEIRQALSTNQGLIAGGPQDGLHETLAAFNFLIASQQQDIIDHKELEQHLHKLEQFALPARLWRSQNLLTENLNQTTVWLKQHGAADFCGVKPTNNSKKEIEYLSNVFQLFFIEKIQGIASQVNHYHYKLSPIFELLLKHPNLTPAFKRYLSQQHQQGFANYQLAMQQHIELWQLIFKNCHLAPGLSAHINTNK
ncbi:DUF3080 family protein [Paraglaciecola hydrolytica]|uniref:DUF3080 family protein n=1 Tax=Paraglaciecola hydrolytica TaxID=1799789 RepID=UPI002286C135|nr:DUF3080 family protein [Paraglaciecola hydrolytica]